jgi:hypothetical protein
MGLKECYEDLDQPFVDLRVSQRDAAQSRGPTSAAIGSRLNRIRQDAWTSQRLVRRWLIWPPVAATSLSILILIGSLALGWSIARGIPATTITNKKGQPIQVLTGTEWTTCTWQGTKHPCRPLDPR